MAAIERTAYPRFKQSLTQRELDEFYTPTEEEVTFVNQAATGRQQQDQRAHLNKELRFPE